MPKSIHVQPLYCKFTLVYIFFDIYVIFGRFQETLAALLEHVQHQLLDYT